MQLCPYGLLKLPSEGELSDGKKDANVYYKITMHQLSDMETKLHKYLVIKGKVHCIWIMDLELNSCLC